MKELAKTILYQPLFNALIFLVWLVPHDNVGWAIIILTIIIRIILLPTSLNATKQQKRLQELQPQIQELQQKYKGDQQKLGQETMRFYRENKVNPLGSCLPLLIQLPVLIVLFYVFTNGLSTAHFDLLYSFVPRPESINTMFLGLDLSQPDKFILPILAGIFQFISTWQMLPKTKPQEGQEMQAMISKQMLYLGPIFTIFIAGRFPAALPLYWAVTNLFTIGQQWYVNKYVKVDAPVVKKIAEKDTKTTVKGGVEVTVRRKGEAK